MRTSINQTGRKMIPADELSITLINNLNLKFKWNFKNLEIDSQSEAILELSSIGKNERIKVDLDHLLKPGELIISLSGYLEPNGITARFKIIKVSNDAIRYILSESKTLRLENNKLEGEHGKSLLDVYNDPNLRMPWQLSFDDGEPVLKVSDYYENAPKIYSHTIFQTNILPEVFRQIVFWLITEDPDESQNLKITLWWQLVHEFGLSAEDRKYFTGLVTKDLQDINDILSKCQEVAENFAVKHKIIQKLNNYITEVE